MNLQERIDFILNNNFPATVKRKHLVYLMQHLGEHSENADELGEAYATIREAIAHIDTLINFEYPKYNPQITVTELDRTLEFFLTYNILTMQQVQEIRTKAAAYLR